MPIYIYRGGSPNPQPQNPLVRFLVSAAILAVIVGLGVLLLPVIGAIALLILGFIALLVVGGVIYRWIYGSPIDNYYRKQREQRAGVRIHPDAAPDQQPLREAQERQSQGRKMRFRSRDQVVEDAVVVEERKRTDSQ